jgi:hypothetical protein
MNKNKTKFIVIGLMFGLLLGLYNCTLHDKGLNVAPATGNVLTSVKTAIAPKFVTGGATWSGADATLWKNAPVLTGKATVPDVEGGTNAFNGFIGNSTTISMQSMYDANYIYFLISWEAAQPNLENSPWFFIPATKQWAQGQSAPTYDVNGKVIMQSFVSDGFMMLFNINNSCADFTSQSCYGACHLGEATMAVDPVTHQITISTTNVMHTNAPNEKLDVWFSRMFEVPQTDQLYDSYMDWNGGAKGNDGFEPDQSVPDGGNPPNYSSNAPTNGTGGFSNVQTLNITGTTIPENVPLWVKPAGSHYTNAALLPADTANAALLVIAVDSNGILTLKGGTILNPNIGTTYQWVGTGIGNNDQTTWIPGAIVAPFTGGEGDVNANAVWTGSGWQMMLKRALKTADVLEQDVDFSPLNNIQFGVAVMFMPSGSINAADNEHAILPGLTLKFQK